jgi:hypothetical protein
MAGLEAEWLGGIGTGLPKMMQGHLGLSNWSWTLMKATPMALSIGTAIMGSMV